MNIKINKLHQEYLDKYGYGVFRVWHLQKDQKGHEEGQGHSRDHVQVCEMGLIENIVEIVYFSFTYASSGVSNVKHPKPESTNVCLRIKNGKQGKWRAICFDLPNPES